MLDNCERHESGEQEMAHHDEFVNCLPGTDDERHHNSCRYTDGYREEIARRPGVEIGFEIGHALRHHLADGIRSAEEDIQLRADPHHPQQDERPHAETISSVMQKPDNPDNGNEDCEFMGADGLERRSEPLPAG